MILLQELSALCGVLPLQQWLLQFHGRADQDLGTSILFPSLQKEKEKEREKEKEKGKDKGREREGNAMSVSFQSHIGKIGELLISSYPLHIVCFFLLVFTSLTLHLYSASFTLIIIILISSTLLFFTHLSFTLLFFNLLLIVIIIIAPVSRTLLFPFLLVLLSLINLFTFTNVPNVQVVENEGEIEVEVAACLLGELAGELSVLDNTEMRSYCVIQLCILLRLLAGMKP